jgi:transcription elongation factor Elf1
MPHKEKRKRTVYQRIYQHKRRIKYKKYILKYKKLYGKCFLCGWNKHSEILQFHHLKKDEKRFRISSGHIGNYNLDTIKKEIQKCQLICPNCHHWIHYKERKWFTKESKKHTLKRLKNAPVA